MLLILCTPRLRNDFTQRANRGKAGNAMQSKCVSRALVTCAAQYANHVSQFDTALRSVTGALLHFCRVEKQRAEEVQAALQRAQQHILDLQDQHRLDLESCNQGHASETARLRSDCYGFQTELAEARQASALTLCFVYSSPGIPLLGTLIWGRGRGGVSLSYLHPPAPRLSYSKAATCTH